MPAVLRFNAGHVGDKYDRLRQAFGLKPNADLPEFIAGLNERLGLPKNLRAMGVTDKHVPGLVPQVLADHCTLTNARKMTAPDVEHMLADAMG
jgi:4-hydroxybutyrate dehydrogenase